MDCLVVGDPHIGGLPAVLPKEVAEKVFPALFEQVFSYALEKAIPNIFFLGDIFNSPYPSENDRLLLNSIIMKYKKLRLRWLMGNHDYADNNHNALIFHIKEQQIGMYGNNDIKFITKRENEIIEGIPISWLPWPYKWAKILNKKQERLVFGHISIPGALADNGFKLKGGKKINFRHHKVLLGDLHTPQRGKGYEYPGAMLQRKFGDVFDRHFLHLTIHKKGAILRTRRKTIKFLPLYTLLQAQSPTLADLPNLNQLTVTQFLRIKAGPEVLANRAKITQKYPNVSIEPLQGIKNDKEKNISIIALQHGKTRRTLLKLALKKDGFKAKDIKWGIQEAEKAEKFVLKGK